MAARHWSQQYVWEAHTRAGMKCGLSTAIMAAIGEGRRPDRMAADEQAVYDFFTELFAGRNVSDATYARAAAMLGEQGIIDILGVAGYYSGMSMILNATRTPPAGAAAVSMLLFPSNCA